MSGFSYGLQMSKMLMEYFDGKITINSISGNYIYVFIYILKNYIYIMLLE